MSSSPKEYLRIQDAAARLGVDYKTIYRLIRQGKLPAAKPGGVYLIRPEDVDQLLEQSRHSTPVSEAEPAHETLRCGRCLRLIEQDAQMGGLCAHTACEEVLCATCWGDEETAERLCYKHTPSRELRYEAARRERAAGRLPALASAAEARQLELTFLSRFDQTVRGIATLKHPAANTLYKNIDWVAAHTISDDSAEAMALLNTGFLDTATLTALPLNTRSVYAVGGRNGLMLEARALNRMERHLADGFDTQPLGTAELLPALTEAIQRAEKSGALIVLGLASPTGWAAEAVEYIASAEPGRAFSHRQVLSYLIDLNTGQVHRHTLDARTAPLAALFSVLLPEEAIEAAARAVRQALVLHDSFTLSQAVSETHFAADTVRQAFDRLVATGAFVVVDAPGLGPAITRR